MDVISNGHRNSTIQTIGFSGDQTFEMEEKAETKVVPVNIDVAETKPDDEFTTEKESAIATEGVLMCA